MIASTSAVVWSADVKWRDTGLMSLPCLMSVRWPRNRSF